MRYAVAPAMVRHVTRWRSHDDGSQGISRAEYDRLAKLRLEALEASYDAKPSPRVAKLLRPVEAFVGGEWKYYGSASLAGLEFGLSGTHVQALALHGGASKTGLRFRYVKGGVL